MAQYVELLYKWHKNLVTCVHSDFRQQFTCSRLLARITKGPFRGSFVVLGSFGVLYTLQVSGISKSCI